MKDTQSRSRQPLKRKRAGARCRQVSALSVALCSTVLVAACGGSSGSNSAKPPGSPGPSLAGPAVKLMVIHEQSTGTATPDIYEGAKVAADAINASGGIQGHRVEVINCDTKNDPNTAASCARQAVSDKVLAVVSSLTPFGDQVLPVLAAGRIPDVGIDPAAGADLTSPVSFPIIGGAPMTFAGLGRALADDGAKKISLARIDIAQAAALSQFVTMGLTGTGAKVVADVKVPPGAPDMATYAAAATANGADAVVVGVSGQDAINLIRAIRQAKPDIPIAFVATELGKVVSALGSSADGLIQSTQATALVNTPTANEFNSQMKAAGYTGEQGLRLNAWLSVHIVKQVAQDLPQLTSAALLDALGKQGDIETGVTVPLQFAKAPISLLPRVFNVCAMTTVIKDGKETLPASSKGFVNVLSGQPCTQPS